MSRHDDASGPTPDPEGADFWRLKLELDVLAETSAEARTRTALIAAFTDEDGDSTTTPEELDVIVARLVERGLLQQVVSSQQPAWLATDQGLDLLDSYLDQK